MIHYQVKPRHAERGCEEKDFAADSRRNAQIRSCHSDPELAEGEESAFVSVQGTVSPKRGPRELPATPFTPQSSSESFDSALEMVVQEAGCKALRSRRQAPGF